LKTGNTTQAIVLSVVAVAALGFMVTRFIPTKAVSVAAASDSDKAPSGKSAAVETLPTEILRDAFSHPALAKRTLAVITKQIDEPPVGIDIQPLGIGGSESAFLPPARGGDIPYIEHEKPLTKGSKPSGNTEKDQQEDKTPRLKIGLKAIMSATKSLALISIDGGPNLMVGPGDQLTAQFRIGQFTKNAVQLVSATGKFWLYVGQEVEK
jgi:hypothetical protein